MAIDAVTESNSYVTGLVSSGTAQTGTSSKTDTKDTTEKSTYVQDNDTAAVYEKNSSSSVYDEKTVKEMLAESNLKTENFKKLIESLLNKQSTKFYSAYSKEDITEEKLSGNLKDFFSNIEVDDETRLQAQNDISEDGYYGVKQTSERILNFAKALAGDDPDKLEEMYSAVVDGFKQAQKMWGDDLPEICSKTLEAVQSGFDEWRNEISSASSAE
jgi:hypothetical protein